METINSLEVIEQRIQDLIDALDNNYRKQHGGINKHCTFQIQRGKRYYKLIQAYIPPSTGRSVHAFIDCKTGEVYKPASWKTPAKHVRYNLLHDESYKTCIKKADWAGSYLYL